MAATTVRGPQVRDGSIQRVDLDIATVGQAVIRKLIAGVGISLSATGADPGTGDVTAIVDPTVDLGLSVAQSVDVTDAGTANVPNILVLGHDSSVTPLVNFGGAILFTGKSDTVLGRTMGDLSWLWTTPADATRSAKLRLRAVNSATFVNSLTLFPSGGASFNATVDPGAGIVNANSGFRVANVPLDVDHLATTATNDSAQAGGVGETISSFITSAAAIAYTTNQTKNLTSISLTAGDWDVRGSLAFNFTTFPASTFFNFIGNIGTVTGTVSDTGGQVAVGITSPATTVSGVVSCAMSPRRISLASTTTVYLVGKTATFASGSCTGFGFIEARRVR